MCERAFALINWLSIELSPPLMDISHRQSAGIKKLFTFIDNDL
ncbi:hypothetical protein SAHL_01650 [Salinisphaera orenii YIM 95161]|uniref:Uncharacterized protein n=1 Tax=Salinisphaera orenii YIM 95161 TaxID=1051139 RepID=A0A423Q9V0_9GAMM|nr:hypothetical protein SAHL_01650 [Salinisphaera halophila YIM 95161]